MAIIILAAPLGGIRGKVGGLIYSAGKSGPYVKPWSKGSNPRSEIQTAQRALLVSFAQTWKSLSAAEKLTWDTYAALPAQTKINSLGADYNVAGFNWYVGINSNLSRAGLPARLIAPVLLTPPTPVIQLARFEDSTGPTESLVKMSAASPGLADYHTAWISVAKNAGVVSPAPRRVWMSTAIPNGFRNLLFQSEVNLKYGIVQDTMVAFYECAIMNADGRVGARASVSATPV